MELIIKKYENNFPEDVNYIYNYNLHKQRKTDLIKHLISYFGLSNLQELKQHKIKIIVPEDYINIDNIGESPYWHYGHNRLVTDIVNALGAEKIENDVIMKEWQLC